MIVRVRNLYVRHIQGERMTFIVESSRERIIPYRVDLLAHGGNGGCNCKDFRMRCAPVLDRGASEYIWCKHIEAAFLFLAQSVIEEAAKSERTITK